MAVIAAPTPTSSPAHSDARPSATSATMQSASTRSVTVPPVWSPVATYVTDGIRLYERPGNFVDFLGGIGNNEHMTNAHLIASANTTAGFAIGIVATGSAFEVVRMDRRSRYVTLSRHTSEAAARTRANAEYRADKGKG